MKHKLFGVVVLSTSLAVATAWGWKSRLTTGLRGGSSVQVSTACGRDIDIGVAIEKLSSYGSETGRALDLLLKYANESPTCRGGIIGALLQAMKKADVKIVFDQ